MSFNPNAPNPSPEGPYRPGPKAVKGINSFEIIGNPLGVIDDKESELILQETHLFRLPIDILKEIQRSNPFLPNSHDFSFAYNSRMFYCLWFCFSRIWLLWKYPIVPGYFFVTVVQNCYFGLVVPPINFSLLVILIILRFYYLYANKHIKLQNHFGNGLMFINWEKILLDGIILILPIRYLSPPPPTSSLQLVLLFLIFELILDWRKVLLMSSFPLPCLMILFFFPLPLARFSGTNSACL